jgi:hypothetical protein
MIADESGQTLPELMIATVIGLIVIFAAFLMLQTSLTQSGNIAQREDASQRGRIALELMTRELRAQICVDAETPSISNGTDTAITFTDDLTGDKAAPMQRTIAYIPPPATTPTAPGTISENDYQGVAGPGFPPSITFPLAPTRSTVLLQQVSPIPGVPIFQYFEFAGTGTPGLSTTPLATPLDAVDEGQAVDIRISFLARGSSLATATANNNGSSFQDDVYTRVANPSDPQGGTNCS